MQYLASLPDGMGYTNKMLNAARDQAHQQYIDSLNSLKIGSPPFGCHQKTTFLPFNNTFYNTFAFNRVGKPWQSTDAVYDDKGKLICSGFADCLNHGSLSIDPSKNLVNDVISRLLSSPTTCNSGCYCTDNLQTNVCSWMQDQIPATVNSGSKSINLFQPQPFQQTSSTFSDLSSIYGPNNDGCNQKYPKCPTDNCTCIFNTLQATESLQLQSGPPNPTQTPWLVFRDPGTQVPNPIPSSDNGISNGSNYIAFDVCKANVDGSGRCNLGDQPPSDTCDYSNQIAKTVESLYCSSITPTALFTNTNPQNSQCIQSGCLSGQKISNRFVTVPSAVSVNIFSAIPITCYRMSCGNSPIDGKIVLDPTSWTNTNGHTLQVTQTQFTYNGWGQIGSSASVPGTVFLRSIAANYDNLATVTEVLNPCIQIIQNKIISAVIQNKITKTCNLNPFNTRSLSSDFDFSNLQSIHVDGQYLESSEDYAMMIQTLIENTEDKFAKDSNIGPACMKQLPNNLFSCTETTTTPQSIYNPTGPQFYNNFYMNQAYECDDTTFMTQCTNLITQLCAGQSKSTVVTTTETDWTGLKTFVKTTTLAESPYTQCMNTVTDIPSCKAVFGATCNIYGYKWTYSYIECTATKTSCPYDQIIDGQSKSWESQYQNAGLPSQGFCPQCTALDGSCPSDKSSSTYSAAQTATGYHQFVSTPVSSGILTPSNAVHFQMNLNTVGSGPTQCNNPSCPSTLQKPVEILKNLYSCVDCFAAPNYQCIGNHMCQFGSWNNLSYGSSFTQAFQAVQKAILASALQSESLDATYLPFLNTYNFSSFNPSSLALTFNTMITALNGQCKQDQTLPDFSNCQNDGPRRSLKSHVEANYKISEGIRLPASSTISWQSGYTQMTSTNIPAWESARPTPFLDQLFNDSVCQTANFLQLVCLKQGSNNLTFFNPSIAGNFEIQDGCDTILADTTRVIDSSCNKLACPYNSDTVDLYNSYDNQGNWMHCKSEDRQTSSFYTTPNNIPINLCSKYPDLPYRCSGNQGVLGGTDGNSVDDLYKYQIPTNVNLGSVQNLGLSSNLSLSPYDIGGNYIRIGVKSNKMTVTGLPLRSYNTLAGARSLNQTNWYRQWQLQHDTEASHILDQYPNPTTCKTWTCPFKRWRFWTGNDPNFRPWTPIPTRTLPFYNTTTHPTTAPARIKDNLLSDYQTRNGFCISPKGQDVSQPTSGPCSLTDTIASLSDGQQRYTKVFGSTCNNQTDWPLTGGQMRDQSYLPNPTGSGCGVLDRIPSFKYRSARFP